MNEYQEEHFQELYATKEKDPAAGLEAYALETGQARLLLPQRLQELRGSEELHGICALIWPFVIGGVWSMRRHAQ